jgi:antirestriction protein ArdC
MKNNNNSDSVAVTKADVYSIITERMISLLEAGTIPWQKPWRVSGNGILPTNYVSKKAYRGLNVFMLAASGYECPFWLSFKQAKEHGGMVRKGEKGTPVIFWKFLTKEDENGKPVMEDGKPVKIPLLRYYTVFNVEQCDGIKWEKPAPIEGSKWEPLTEAERIVADMKKRPEIKHGGERAYYSPSLDYIRMPQRESFAGGEEYYSTLFHELTHATGHQSRLNRKGVSSTLPANHSFGSSDYSREELVAEMGAAFLAGHAGFLHRTVNNSAAYLQGWLKALKGDSKLVVIAAAQAQKASDFILGTTFQVEE